jgi:hypothetical protein
MLQRLIHSLHMQSRKKPDESPYQRLLNRVSAVNDFFLTLSLPRMVAP